MLRILSGIGQLLWGSNTTQEQTRYTTPISTFSSRLKALHYDEAKIPDYFLCPVSLCIMENPVMVNKHQNHTFDESSLLECLKTQPDIDPMRMPIAVVEGEKDISANTERKLQIEIFVSTLEAIKRLENQLEELSNKIDLAAATQGTGITREQYKRLLREQKEAQRNSILQKKAMLAVELQTFVTLAETVINAEDKQTAEKQIEIEKITADKYAYLNKLRGEIGLIYPDLFPKKPVILDIDIDDDEQSPKKDANHDDQKKDDAPKLKQTADGMDVAEVVPPLAPPLLRRRYLPWQPTFFYHSAFMVNHPALLGLPYQNPHIGFGALLNRQEQLPALVLDRQEQPPELDQDEEIHEVRAEVAPSTSSITNKLN